MMSGVIWRRWSLRSGQNKSRIALNGRILLRRSRLHQSCSAIEEEDSLEREYTESSVQRRKKIWMLKYLGYLVRNANNAVAVIHVRIIAGHIYHRALGHVLNERHITHSVGGGLYKIMMTRNVVQRCRITDPDG
jgi:hypothetical protein